MSNDLEAATDRVFAAIDEFRTGEAVHATRQVAKALARAALEGVREKVEARTECPIGLDDRRNLCSAGTCRPCLYDRVKSTKARAEKAEADAEKLAEALEFYADAKGWNEPPIETVHSELFGVAYRNRASEIRTDRGKIARAALASYKERAD
jgi:hypothetical protein